MNKKNLKISFHKYNIQIISPKLCHLVGLFLEVNDIKAAALWPFLILKYGNHPNNSVWINHEKIHFRQQIEALFIFHLMIYYGEILYFRFVKKLSAQQAYLNTTFEQECYRNQYNLDYLNTRK